MRHPGPGPGYRGPVAYLVAGLVAVQLLCLVGVLIVARRRVAYVLADGVAATQRAYAEGFRAGARSAGRHRPGPVVFSVN